MKTRDILIVDDDSICRHLLSKRLEHAGFGVSTSSEGIQALAMMEEHTYRVVVTDFNMPEMNGFELASRVRERHAGTPVVLVTSNDLSEVSEGAGKAGIREVFSKPVDFKQLVSAIRSLL